MTPIFTRIYDNLYADRSIPHVNKVHYAHDIFSSDTGCMYHVKCDIAISHERNSLVIDGLHCEVCAAAFLRSFPETETFLQRKLLLANLKVSIKLMHGCLVCYKQNRRVWNANYACGYCIDANEQEARIIIQKWSAIKEVFGADVGRLIAGHLLHFCGFFLKKEQKLKAGYPIQCSPSSPEFMIIFARIMMSGILMGHTTIYLVSMQTVD